jgi:hypothetical protein
MYSPPAADCARNASIGRISNGDFGVSENSSGMRWLIFASSPR